MKKLAFLLAFVLVISMPIHTLAAPRAILAKPQLMFSGTTGTCSVTIAGNSTSDHIEIAMNVMYGLSCVASWTADGYGYITMSETFTAVKYRTYRLQLEVRINGVQQDPVRISGTC